ncbi:MerR family transcriptional regulator [Shewanella litorisediminis]|uniref:MerR family transcriptional regulator n=1 Tax=Shewanella litorisediminis TaxID=1173586 RepID=A0ABX7G085_9GAMM|nr:MerR family transcriptional regulator [Shewanella litorisediminis]MCL2918270.1 MerR family transcriptional regulator [Shewanella litorisediminis]QRH00681.1 MerR family transcriptional regulator [Shewanella litorisediminis]
MEQQYGINELAGVTGIPVRTIRFYLQKGLLTAPHGAGRGAWYDNHHLEQLIKLQMWQAAGLSLERIGELLKQEAEPMLPLLNPKPGELRVCSHLQLAPGLSLVIDPIAAGLDSDKLRTLAAAMMSTFDTVLNKEGDK